MRKEQTLIAKVVPVTRQTAGLRLDIHAMPFAMLVGKLAWGQPGQMMADADGLIIGVGGAVMDFVAHGTGKNDELGIRN